MEEGKEDGKKKGKKFFSSCCIYSKDRIKNKVKLKEYFYEKLNGTCNSFSECGNLFL